MHKLIIGCVLALALLGCGSEGKLPQGKTLSLHKATDADLAALSTGRDLESLSLAFSEVTDGGLEHLEDLAGLQSLNKKRICRDLRQQLHEQCRPLQRR